MERLDREAHIKVDEEARAGGRPDAGGVGKDAMAEHTVALAVTLRAMLSHLDSDWGLA